MKAAALLALLLLMAGSAVGQPNSNWATNLTQVTSVPYGSSIFGLGTSPDGYVYTSGLFTGTSRALVSCVTADPTNSACWTAINTGLPAGAGAHTYMIANPFVFPPSGKVIAILTDITATPKGRIGSWDPNTATWTVSSYSSSAQLVSLTLDVSDIYIASGSILKSTDGGNTFTDMTGGDAYGAIGYTPGIIKDARVWGGNIYWGGEGPLIKQPLTFASFQSLLPTANGGCTNPNCYTGNMRYTTADGNSVTGAQAEVLALIHNTTGPPNSSVQRLDVAGTGLWSSVSQTVIPGYSPTTTDSWNIRQITQGTTAHEYYICGGGNNNGTGVMGTIDGGITWSFVGQILTSANNNDNFQYLAISSNDSRFVGRNADLWVQAAPTSAILPIPVLNGGAKVQGKVVIQ